jgi:hypothetical protein
LQPEIKESLLQAFIAGFKAGQQVKSDYTDEQIKYFYDEYCNDFQPLESKYLILKD